MSNRHSLHRIWKGPDTVGTVTIGVEDRPVVLVSGYFVPLPALAGLLQDALDAIAPERTWTVEILTGFQLRVSATGGTFGWASSSGWDLFWGVTDPVGQVTEFLGTAWTAAMAPRWGFQVGLPILVGQRVLVDRPGAPLGSSLLSYYFERRILPKVHPKEDRALIQRMGADMWIVYTDGVGTAWNWDNLDGWVLVRPLEGRGERGQLELDHGALATYPLAVMDLTAEVIL